MMIFVGLVRLILMSIALSVVLMDSFSVISVRLIEYYLIACALSIRCLILRI